MALMFVCDCCGWDHRLDSAAQEFNYARSCEVCGQDGCTECQGAPNLCDECWDESQQPAPLEED